MLNYFKNKNKQLNDDFVAILKHKTAEQIKKEIEKILKRITKEAQKA